LKEVPRQAHVEDDDDDDDAAQDQGQVLVLL
jgi:hypothetical protein